MSKVSCVRKAEVLFLFSCFLSPVLCFFLLFSRFRIALKKSWNQSCLYMCLFSGLERQSKFLCDLFLLFCRYLTFFFNSNIASEKSKSFSFIFYVFFLSFYSFQPVFFFPPRMMSEKLKSKLEKKRKNSFKTLYKKQLDLFDHYYDLWKLHKKIRSLCEGN